MMVEGDYVEKIGAEKASESLAVCCVRYLEEWSKSLHFLWKWVNNQIDSLLTYASKHFPSRPVKEGLPDGVRAALKALLQT